jgi:mannose-6-phosphate isomerase-like protein (cupin superfamily)
MLPPGLEIRTSFAAQQNEVPTKKERKRMRVRLARGKVLTMGILLCAATVSMGSGVPAAVHYIDHDKVTAVMAKSGPIVSDPGLVVLAQRRKSGMVEYHEHTNHVFIIAEGEATLIVGGTMVNPKETGPGQTRADAIDGGETFHLSKGDVVTIPAKTPHWFKEVPTTTVAYYAINIESD